MSQVSGTFGAVARRKPLRVCVIGAECTGKTTLARDLADHYGAPVLLEQGREYFTDKAARGDCLVRAGDVVRVVDMQVRLEDSAPLNEPLIIMDTDAFTISVWYPRYTGRRFSELDRLIAMRQAGGAKTDLYLLASADIPFEHDSIRSCASFRDEMQQLFRDELERTDRPFVEISGTRDERLARSIAAIDTLLAPARHPMGSVAVG